MDVNRIASVQKPSHSAVEIEPVVRSPTIDLSQTSNLPNDPLRSPQSVHVISSLIDSLSAVPGAPVQEEKQGIYRFEDHYDPPASPPLQDADELDRNLNDPIADDRSDGEVAAAPVIRYARRPPPLSKRSSKSRLYSLNMTQPGLAPRTSSQSLKSLAETESVGVPSIERRHGSSASSTFSIISGVSALRRRPTTESLRDNATARPIPPMRISSSARRKKTESLYSMEQEKENRTPKRSSSIDGYSPGAMQQDPVNGESPPLSTLNRFSRGDLGNHLIPSRRSSLRRSVTGLSETTHDSNRISSPVRNLKELNIDSELIDGDNSTVRRIRELQEAREKRQKEWRNEARKSERAAKRHTIAVPKVSSQRTGSYQSSRLSVTDVVVESPEVESPLDISATVNASDLASMPALIPAVPNGEMLTPYKGTSPAVSNPNSAAPSRVNSTYRSPATQTKRNSTNGTIKQEPPLAELRSISDEVDTFLGAPRLTQKIRHPRTGRTIAFSEVGDPHGFVVLCCVGMGLTRYLTAFYDELARTLRLRLITPDRPGVGESSAVPEASCTPLNWVDDVAVICSSLGVTRFSLLAHSAGAIYALAAALKMPQYVRGRIHLLAPWIPPSQMPKGAALGPDSQPIANLPFSHKILSVLPAQILKVANSRFLTATSASVDTRPLKARKNKGLENIEASWDYALDDMENPFSNPLPDMEPMRPQTGRSVSCYQANNEFRGLAAEQNTSPRPRSRRQTQSSSKVQSPNPTPLSPRLTPEARQTLYNQTLTHRIWALATNNANPAIDLVVCLERRKPIGFRYPEVTRSVVIHHGAKDTRVPLDNVRWLQSVMKRCELRVLDSEGHGLMASASAMATVLGEIAKEWEEWEKVAKGKEKRKKEEGPSTFSRPLV
ncbi:hypothetical protein H2202_006581 [Exophiala xenobiotica]|nr:hypothetical protein H2202_006581 [Exophiala xenobiotica]KAK5235695.1 hypothetical protein LTR47_003168 [Exophiala xenobiotica]KAK5250516.1 hypothetical protein LTS06_004770 [Exophiala xenobiotica]KAK5262218.1 hypothetical protein LTR40_000785 [Exophiala xenobiotica]KAK5353926.1 hypothetical protein LTR61_002620 [Exophiala xenobiotica]